MQNGICNKSFKERQSHIKESFYFYCYRNKLKYCTLFRKYVLQTWILIRKRHLSADAFRKLSLSYHSFWEVPSRNSYEYTVPNLSSSILYTYLPNVQHYTTGETCFIFLMIQFLMKYRYFSLAVLQEWAKALPMLQNQQSLFKFNLCMLYTLLFI